MFFNIVKIYQSTQAVLNLSLIHIYCIRYRMELDIFQNSVYYFTVNVQVYNIDVRCVYQVTESFGGHGEVSSYGQAVFVFLHSVQYTRNTIVPVSYTHLLC